ncbi:MAG: hypothetical protein AAF488_09955 [Planctomycetota bacterium]
MNCPQTSPAPGATSWTPLLDSLLEELPTDLLCSEAHLVSTADGARRRLAHSTGFDCEPLVSETQRERASVERAPHVFRDLGDGPVASWMMLPLLDAAGTRGNRSPGALQVWLATSRPSEEISVATLAEVRDLVVEHCVDAVSREPRREVPEFARALLDTMPVPVLVTDSRGGVLCANDNFDFIVRRLGCTIGESIEGSVPREWTAVFARTMETTIDRNEPIETPLPTLPAPFDLFDFRLSTGMIEAHRGGPALVLVVREVSVGTALSEVAELRRELGK